jgi:hypothetical protein
MAKFWIEDFGSELISPKFSNQKGSEMGEMQPSCSDDREVHEL